MLLRAGFYGIASKQDCFFARLYELCIIMKRILHQTLCLLMACIVLITSTGFGLVEHSCMMRGKKVTLAVVAEASHCQGCPDQKQTMTANKPVVKKTACCQDDQRYENVSFTSSISQLLAKFVKSVTDLALSGLQQFFDWLLQVLLPSESIALAADSSPPLRSGRTLLAFVQSFLL